MTALTPDSKVQAVYVKVMGEVHKSHCINGSSQKVNQYSATLCMRMQAVNRTLLTVVSHLF